MRRSGRFSSHLHLILALLCILSVWGPRAVGGDTLSVWVVSTNNQTGEVELNGHDAAGPAGGIYGCFTWEWGDGTATMGCFPQTHTYADTNKNYVVRVTSHYTNVTVEYEEVDVTFGDSSTVGRPDPYLEIAIPDVNLKQAVCWALGLYGAPILTRGDMQCLTSLDAENRHVADLTGLEYASDLEVGMLGGNDFTDLSPLQNLSKLRHLDLGSTPVVSLAPLANLVNLTYLVAVNNPNINDVSALSDCMKLTSLYLHGNQIGDIGPLAALPDIEILILHDNRINDLGPLAGMEKLVDLDLRNNQISDVLPLSNLARLARLNLAENSISSISLLLRLNGLEDLDLGHNQIMDVSVISAYSNLTRLSLRGNQIRSISALSGLAGLERLALQSNYIADLEPLLRLGQLSVLQLDGNPLTPKVCMVQIPQIEANNPGIEITGVACLSSTFPGGSGTARDPYHIVTKADLLQMADDPGSYGYHFILLADIDLAGERFAGAVIAQDIDAPAAGDAAWWFDGTSFSGGFDGNGHSINNLTIDTQGAEGSYLGLFGYIDPAGVVSDLTLNGCTVVCGDESHSVGGLAGYNSGVIEDCHVVGSVTGGLNNSRLGLLVGENRGTMADSSARGSLSVEFEGRYCGGLVGHNLSASITRCYANAAITVGGNSSYLGGLIGQNNSYEGAGYSNVLDCYAMGSISGDATVTVMGGLIGNNMAGEGAITHCYSVCSVTGGDDETVGGLVGRNESGDVAGCVFLSEASGGGPDNGIGIAKSMTAMKSLRTFTGQGWDFGSVWRIWDHYDYPRLQWDTDMEPLSVILSEDTSFEIRGRVYCSDPEDPLCGPGAHELVPVPPLDPNTLTLSRLELSPDVNVVLTDYFRDQAENQFDVLYVADLVLGENAQLNLAGKRLYYETLVGLPGQIVNQKVYVDLLAQVGLNDPNTFDNDVTTNNTPDQTFVSLIDSADVAPTPVMHMQSIDNTSARAKTYLGRYSQDEVLVSFSYMFNSDHPDAVLEAYLSDKEGLLPLDDPHMLLAGRFTPPIMGFPGSMESGEFASYSMPVTVPPLDPNQGLWLELILFEPPAPLGGFGFITMGEGQDGVYARDLTLSSICFGVCMDLTSDGRVTPEDYTLIGAGAGRSVDSDVPVTSPLSCIDRGYSRDGRTDIGDVVGSGDLMARSGSIDVQNLCSIPMAWEGDAAQVGSTFISFGITAPMAAPAAQINSDLLFLGKGSTFVFGQEFLGHKDLLYGFDDISAGSQEYTLPDNEGQIRLVRGDPDVLILGIDQGLCQLNGDVVVGPGRHVFQGKTVNIGVRESNHDQLNGRPLRDVAFHDGFAYVVPVIVEESEDVLYQAAAKLELTGGGYEIRQLYYDSALAPFSHQSPNLEGLREIEVDRSGRVHLLNAHYQNSSDMLWVFDNAGTVVNRHFLNRLPDNPLDNPVGLCYDAFSDRLYVGSGVFDPLDPSRSMLYGYASESILSDESLMPVHQVTIENLQHLTDISSDQQGGLWVTGIKLTATPEILNVYDLIAPSTRPLPGPRLAQVDTSEDGASLAEAVSLYGTMGINLPTSILYVPVP